MRFKLSTVAVTYCTTCSAGTEYGSIELVLSSFHHKSTLEMVVFVSGALLMIFEVTGSRLLAPYIGNSVYIWTSLIGVIMASLSVGYYLGGRAADKNPALRTLAGVLFAAAALLSITLLIQDFFLSALATLAVRLEIKAILAALILFAPASTLFGFVTPYAVRLKMLSVEDAGKTVGRLYALSTVGSICGTFLAGFFLLPFVGSIRTLYLLTAILFALSLMVAPPALTTRKLYAMILFVVAIGLNEFVRFSLARDYDLHDIDTEYSRVRVFRTTDDETKKQIEVLTLDPFSTQSAIYLDSDEMVLKYARFYHLLRHFNPDFQKTLIIGGAGYSFPKEYLRTYPGKQVDVVEIDPQMTAIARRFFRLQDNPNLRIFHQDGRVFLNQNRETYDVVLVDAFGSVYSVPFQLTTREAVQKMNDSLSDDGVVILNMISAIEGDSARFLQAEYKTYSEIFSRVLVFKVHSEKADTETQNLILVASKAKNLSLESNDEEISKLLENLYRKPLNLTVPALTDDLAPVEYYNSFAQKSAEIVRQK